MPDGKPKVTLNRFNSPRGSLCTCMPKYALNPYLGRCGHGCVYCYSVKFPGFRGDARPRLSLVENIEEMAKNTRSKLPVMISPATDPYQPLESRFMITRRCVEVLGSHGFPLLVVTKSSLVTRDIDILRGTKAVVAMTVTTLSDEKARVIEPNAPPPSERIEALERMADEGIAAVARIDPLIPTFNDGDVELEDLVRALAGAGVKHITVSTLKLVRGSASMIRRADPELLRRLWPLYRRGTWIKGYRYLPVELRRSIVARARSIVLRSGITFGTCREGFSGLNTSLCDGTAYCRGQGLLRGSSGGDGFLLGGEIGTGAGSRK